MAVKITRPDGTPGPEPKKGSLDPNLAARVRSSFAAKKDKVVQDAQEAFRERTAELAKIEKDKSLRASAAPKDFKA